MTIRERIQELKENDYIVYHKALGDTPLLNGDFIRWYYSDHYGNVEKFINSSEIEEINNISEDDLNLEYSDEEVWIIGGDLCLSLVMVTDAEKYIRSKRGS